MRRVAIADSYSTNKGTALTVDAANGVLKNDTDPDTGDTLTAVLNANVAHGVLALNANGSFTYTPAAGYGGPDSFTYHASDGTLSSSTVTVSLTVNDRAPVANADSYTTNEDTPLVVPANGVLANDTDPDAGDTLTAVLNTSVTHGTLTLNSNGSFTYTPAANYNGPDSFTYHANDGTLDSPAVTVTITVAPVNDPPTFTSTAPTTASGRCDVRLRGRGERRRRRHAGDRGASRCPHGSRSRPARTAAPVCPASPRKRTSASTTSRCRSRIRPVRRCCKTSTSRSRTSTSRRRSRTRSPIRPRRKPWRLACRSRSSSRIPTSRPRASRMPSRADYPRACC